jgi:hypothetical protein
MGTKPCLEKVFENLSSVLTSKELLAANKIFNRNFVTHK